MYLENRCNSVREIRERGNCKLGATKMVLKKGEVSRVGSNVLNRS